MNVPPGKWRVNCGGPREYSDGLLADQELHGALGGPPAEPIPRLHRQAVVADGPVGQGEGEPLGGLRLSHQLQRIAKRLERLPEELAFKPQFDYIVVNDDLDQAVDRIRNIIRESA